MSSEVYADSPCDDILRHAQEQQYDYYKFFEMRGTDKITPPHFAHGLFNGVFFREAYNNRLVTHILPGSKVLSFCFDLKNEHHVYLLTERKIQKWDWFEDTKIHCVNVGINLGPQPKFLEQNEKYLLVTGSNSFSIFSKENYHEESEEESKRSPVSPSTVFVNNGDVQKVIGAWFVRGTEEITVAAVDANGFLQFTKHDHIKDGNQEKITVYRPNSEQPFSGDFSKIFWSPFGNAFVIQEEKTDENGNSIDEWTTSVHAPDGSVTSVLEEKDDVNIAFNKNGSRMVSRNRLGKIKMYRTYTQYDTEFYKDARYDTEFLKENCTQCRNETKDREEANAEEEESDHCVDPISLKPLNRHPPLYRTPLEHGGGDGTCWNKDYGKEQGQDFLHPNTRGKWRTEFLKPPSHEDDKFEFMYEIEDVRLDRSVKQTERNVAVCGPEEYIMVIIPDKYGLVWCYDEMNNKIIR